MMKKAGTVYDSAVAYRMYPKVSGASAFFPCGEYKYRSFELRQKSFKDAITDNTQKFHLANATEQLGILFGGRDENFDGSGNCTTAVPASSRPAFHASSVHEYDK
jgi:hypothetical protein